MMTHHDNVAVVLMKAHQREMSRFKANTMFKDSIVRSSIVKKVVVKEAIKKSSIAATLSVGSFMYSGMLLIALSLSTNSYAQRTQPNNTPAPQSSSAEKAVTTSSTTANAQNKHDYGTNPNIFAVIGRKTQEKVVQSAEKVGEVAEKGASKIKPSVEQAWDVVSAKPVYKAPIEHKSLSQPSSAPVTNKLPVPQSATQPAPTPTAPVATPAPAPVAAPTPDPQTKATTDAPVAAPTSDPQTKATTNAPVALPSPVQPRAVPSSPTQSQPTSPSKAANPALVYL